MMLGSNCRTTQLWTAIALLPALAVLWLQATWPLPFFSDDSFISLRYTDRLLNGHGLTWTDDGAGLPEYVEGYSNLLWVALTSCLGAIGIELVLAARLLGLFCTLLALWWLTSALRPDGAKRAITASVAPLLVASTQPVMIWTLAGLEGPLVLALLAAGFSGLVRRYGYVEQPNPLPATNTLRAGLPFAAVCLTRPDGPIWALMAGTGIALVVMPQGIARAVRSAFLFGLPALLAVSCQLAFRISYYGDLVPNTAHVKAELSASSIWPGLIYALDAMLAIPGLSLAAIIGAILLLLPKQSRAFSLVLLLPIAAWLAYLILIGGDHFPGQRLLHGLLAPLALLIAVALSRLRNNQQQLAAAILIGITASWWNFDVARHHPGSKEARAEAWEWHDKVLGETLRTAFGKQQARIAVDAAGALPYYSKLPAIDMLGLCDRTIATTPFRDWLETVRPGTPKPPGHLRGNGDYVIQKQPDLIRFKQPLPVFVSGCEFEDDERFLANYRLIRLDLNQPELLPKAHIEPLWIRIDGVAGIQRNERKITIPAYLFGAFRLPGPVINRWQPPSEDQEFNQLLARNGALAAQFWNDDSVTAEANAQRGISLRLRKSAHASLHLPLDPGTYRINIDPHLHGTTLDITQGGDLNDAELTVTNAGIVKILITAASDREARLRSVSLNQIR